MRGLLPRGGSTWGMTGWMLGALFLLKLTALERDQPEQLDTAVTPLAVLYESTTMTMALMALWLHVGGIPVCTLHGGGVGDCSGNVN